MKQRGGGPGVLALHERRVRIIGHHREVDDTSPRLAPPNANAHDAAPTRRASSSLRRSSVVFGIGPWRR